MSIFGIVRFTCESLVSLGETVMIDFGLAGLFDRFEKTFGQLVTKLILGLVGLTIVVVCVGLIVQFLNPIFLWLTDEELGAKYTIRAYAVSYLIMTIVIAVYLTTFVSSFVERRSAVKEGQEYTAEARALHDELQHLRSMARKFFDDPEIQAAIKKWEEKNPELVRDLSADNQSPPNTEEKKQP